MESISFMGVLVNNLIIDEGFMIELSEAEKVLTAFIIEMNKWELKYYRLFRNDDTSSYKDMAKKDLDDIFLSFFINKIFELRLPWLCSKKSIIINGLWFRNIC